MSPNCFMQEVVCLPKSLNVVSTVGSSGEIRQVELNLIPALIESHGHGANERLDTSGGLVVGGTESATHVLVIENLHLEGEVLLQLYAKKIERVRNWTSICDGTDLRS